MAEVEGSARAAAHPINLPQPKRKRQLITSTIFINLNVEVIIYFFKLIYNKKEIGQSSFSMKVLPIFPTKLCGHAISTCFDRLIEQCAVLPSLNLLRIYHAQIPRADLRLSLDTSRATAL